MESPCVEVAGYHWLKEQLGTEFSEGEVLTVLKEIDRVRLGVGSNGLKLEKRGAEEKLEE
jgi:hypothetical protein